MDFQSKTYDLGWLRSSVLWIGILLIIAAVGLAGGALIVKEREQGTTIDTYRFQALQAATPGRFALALRHLDKALGEAGMISGNTAIGITGSHEDIAFKREQFLLLAERSEALAAVPLSSLEVSYGLPDLKKILGGIGTGAYGFWLLQQGGIWYAVYLPLLGFFFGLIVAFVSDAIPFSVKRRVKVVAKPT